MNKNAQDIMMGAPSVVEQNVDELHITIVEGGKGRLRAFRNFILIKRRAFALLFIWEYFALRRDPTLSTVTK